MPAQNIKTQKLSKEETDKKHEEKPPAIQDVLVPEGTPPMTDLQRAVADPRTARPPEILALQSKYGNEAVQRLLIEHNLQAKLTIGAANDAYEQEADHIAAQVMSAPAQAPAIQRQGEEEEEIQTKPLAATITPLIQRQPIPEEEEEGLLQGKSIQRQAIPEEEEELLQGKFIQRQAIPEEDEEKPLQGKLIQRQPELEEEEVQTKSTAAGGSFAPSADFESRLAATRGSGRPLPKTTRDFMEQRFGADFSGVRVHIGSESAHLNTEVSAQAFTRGQDIYLGEGKENAESSEGKQLLAHELTHVVQQTGVQQKSSFGTAGLQRLIRPVIQRVTLENVNVISSKTFPGRDDFIKMLRNYRRVESETSTASEDVKGFLLQGMLDIARPWIETAQRDDMPEHVRFLEGVIIQLRTRIARLLADIKATALTPAASTGTAAATASASSTASGTSGTTATAPATASTEASGAVSATASATETVSKGELIQVEAQNHFHKPKYKEWQGSLEGKRYRFYNKLKDQQKVILPAATTEGSQAYWFNYFWYEAQGKMSDLERVRVLEGWIESDSADWSSENAVIATTSDAQKLACMKVMVDKGMLKYDVRHQVVPAEVLEQLGITQKISIGFRGETWLTKETAESKGKLPQVADTSRAEKLHMDEPWHPYSIPQIANVCLFRNVNKDNCKYTLTSIAKEFADASKFPFVQEMDKEKIEPVVSGSSVVAGKTKIRIFMVNASEMTLYDPVKAGASKFARGGEFAVQAITPDQFLAELEVTRLHPIGSAEKDKWKDSLSCEFGHRFKVSSYKLMRGVSPDIQSLVEAKIRELQAPQTYSLVANPKTDSIAGTSF